VNSADPTMARFRFPTGLATDATGNIYVADSLNHAIRMISPANAVTTLATGFFQPNAIAVDQDSNLWVADTRNHQVKLINSGTGALLATVGEGSAGVIDSLVAAAAQFNQPRGLTFLSSSGGVLVADTGNNTIRRIYTNSAISGFSVQTVAGVAGIAGSDDGATNTATFNAPIGLASDIGAGTVLVADSSGPAMVGGALRLIQTSDPLPKVANPEIGYLVRVTNAMTGAVTTEFNPVTQSIFNNEVFLAVKAEDGVESRFTFGPTPSDPFSNAISDPAENDQSPPVWDGGFNFPNALISPIIPDLTIKMRSFADNRMSSDVVSSRFQFKTANPSVTGDNAALFTLNNITTNAQMFYTLDLSDPPDSSADALAAGNVFGPVSGGGSVSLDFGTNETLTVKIRAYAANFEPSGTTTRQFSKSSFSANKISFGFESGEGSSQFLAASGQIFYAPITLDLHSDVSITAMQFSLSSTNLGASPALAGAQRYRTLLEAQIPGSDPPVLVPLNPAIAYTNVNLGAAASFQMGLTNLLVTNTTFATGNDLNQLLIGYVERIGENQVYATGEHDLIAFSRAHNNRFEGGAGKVLVGAYGITIPGAAANGDKYRIAISRPSAVLGVEQDVLIVAPTNGAVAAGGPISAVKEITVGQPGYIVGDVMPFGWYNAGDFGDTNLLVNDLIQVYQSAIYGLNSPPAGSDFFDAMDASDGSATLTFDGLDNAAIDAITTGDGSLNIDDVFVTFRRSLDPNLKWYRRFWSGGVRMVQEVPNQFRGDTNSLLANIAAKPLSPAARANTPAQALSGERPFVRFIAGDAVPAPTLNQVQIPITAKVKGDHPLRTLMLNLSVVPLDGAPMISDPVTFVPANFGAPSIENQSHPWNYAGIWLDHTVAGIATEALIGTLVVTLPEGANLDSAYAVRFAHASGSPNGYGILPHRTRDGLLTLRDRSHSSLGDSIPDSWRLRHFGTLFNLLSHEDADADGDGIPNWAEHRAGTHPNDASSALKLASRKSGAASNGSGLTVRWPSADGKRYVIECSPTMVGGDWTVVSPVLTGDGDELEFTDSADGEPRFYRIRLIED